MLVHRQINYFLEGHLLLQHSDVNTIISEVSSSLSSITQLTRDNQNELRNKWLSNHENKVWKVIFLRWLNENNNIAIVNVEKLYIQLLCKIKPYVNVQPGVKLNSRLVLNKTNDKYNLEFVAD